MIDSQRQARFSTNFLPYKCGAEAKEALHRTSFFQDYNMFQQEFLLVDDYRILNFADDVEPFRLLDTLA